MELDPRSAYDRHVHDELSPLLGDPIDVAKIAELTPIEAGSIIRSLLSRACSAQHARNHQLGRGFLTEMPRAWLVDKVFHIAELELNLNDEWEFRRLLELFATLDSGLLKRLVEVGRMRSNPEIREAAEEFARSR